MQPRRQVHDVTSTGIAYPFQYLVQSAITTMEGVQSDVLFSYQPPFNILAFMILKPATFILSPRALHSANVFLIKLTSFPVLVIIGIYERHLAAGRQFRESGKDAAHSLFNSLPRNIKNMPLVEALIGSSSNEVYDAVFEVDVPSDHELFEDSEEESISGPRSRTSRDNLQEPATPVSKRHARNLLSIRTSPNHSQLLGVNPPLSAAEQTLGVPSNEGNQSPLARLFGRIPTAQAEPRFEASVKRVEALLENVRHFPFQRFEDALKELQDRQTRIENSLLVITRNLQNMPADKS